MERAKVDMSEQNSAEPQTTAPVTTATTFSQPLFSPPPPKSAAGVGCDRPGVNELLVLKQLPLSCANALYEVGYTYRKLF